MLLKPYDKASGLFIAVLWTASLYFETGDLALYRDTLTVWPMMSFFLAGIAGFYIDRSIGDKVIHYYYWNTIAALCGALVLYCGITDTFDFFDEGINRFNLYSWCFGPIFALMIISASRSRGIGSWLFNNPFIRATGCISYSLYLMHMLVYIYFSQYIKLDEIVAFYVPLGALFLMGTLFYFGVERPCTMLGKTWARKYALSDAQQSDFEPIRIFTRRKLHKDNKILRIRSDLCMMPPSSV